MDVKSHWEHIYATKQPSEASWYRREPTRSLELLDRIGVASGSAIIDVGAGESTLVDALLARGLSDLTLLDISGLALARTRARLGKRAASVTWMEGDVTRVGLPEGRYDAWHDRAVFHFLTDTADRARYVVAAGAAIRPGGHLVIATFAADGPPRCSGLDVVRYSPEALAREFVPAFVLEESSAEVHVTPAGAEQRFTWAVLRRE